MSVRRLAMNLGSYNVSQVLSSGIQFGWGVYLANMVGPSEYGRYAAVVAFVSLFAAGLDFGMELVVVRDVAKRRDLTPKYLGGLMVWRAVSIVLVGIVVLLTARVFGFPEDMRLLIGVFYISTAIQSLVMAGTIILQGLERFALIGIVNLGQGAAAAASGVMVVKGGYGLLGVFSAYIMVAFLTLLVVGAITWRVIPRIGIRPGRELLVYMMKEAAPIGTVAIFSSVYSRADRVILTKMVGAVAVGWYNAGSMLVQGIMDLIWSTLNRVTYPILSRIETKDSAALAKATELLVVVFASVFGFVSIVVCLLSGDIVRILYPRGGFEEAGKALGILVWLTTPTILWAIYKNVLIVKGRQTMYAATAAGGMLVNILLNLLFIQLWGWIGAAYAAIATQVFLLVVTYACIRQVVAPMLPLRAISKVAAVSVVVAVVMWLAHRSGNAFTALPLVGCAYIAALFMVGAFKASDWATVRRVL